MNEITPRLHCAPAKAAAGILQRGIVFFLAGALLLPMSPPAVASRMPVDQPLNYDEVVAHTQWIFAGRILRIRDFSPDYIGAPRAVLLDVSPGLILRGNPPKSLRMVYVTRKTMAVGGLYLFFVNPDTGPFGVDSGAVDVQPYSTPLLAQTKARIARNPYQPHPRSPLTPPAPAK